MDQLAAKLLKDHNIAPKTPEVTSRLGDALESIAYNISSIVATVALLSGSKKILPDSHVTMARTYIDISCKEKEKEKEKREKVGGGVGMPGEYFGLETGGYTSSAAGTVMNTIDFGRELARPAIGGGARKKDNKAVKAPAPPAIPFTLIRPIIKSHQVSISTGGRHELEALINEHLACLFDDMSKGVLSISKLEKLLKQKRYGVFN